MLVESLLAPYDSLNGEGGEGGVGYVAESLMCSQTVSLQMCLCMCVCVYEGRTGLAADR